MKRTVNILFQFSCAFALSILLLSFSNVSVEQPIALIENEVDADEESSIDQDISIYNLQSQSEDSGSGDQIEFAQLRPTLQKYLYETPSLIYQDYYASPVMARNSRAYLTNCSLVFYG